MQTASGYVLAGGRSTRMSRDKALMEWQGSTLLEHAVQKIKYLGLDAAILSANPAHERFGRLVRDLRPDSGPLAGIEAALLDAEDNIAIILPVDMPYLSTSLLKLMLQRADLTGAAVTLPVEQGSAQPLVGVFRPVILPTLSRAIGQGAKAVYQTLVECAHGSLDLFAVETLEAVGQLPSFPHLRSFDNLNTPADIGSGSR